MTGGNTELPIIAATEWLHVPHRKRMSYAYVTGESGSRELCIYYGDKEISFDEERLFAFGEQLASQSSFLAESAAGWGAGYAWPEVHDMLSALVHEGILRRGEPADDPRGGGLVPSLLPPSHCPVARSWAAETCESIVHDLAGRSVEIGHLEAIVSVYRIAHPALDSDDRQVGEANTFPPALRLDRETEWRVCQYSGSRYRDDRPMNVTALKAMIKYWKPMMAVVLECRSAVRRRLPRLGDGNHWTVGDLHTFAGIVLSLPAFQLMSNGATSPAPLHPVLSSLFRITDGIRMVTHAMLFLSDERPRAGGEPITADDVYRFAERNGSFLSDAGVCAGPRAMIDEFFAAVFDGTPVKGADRQSLPGEVRALLDQLPAAIEYALLGLQTWAESRPVWVAMSRAFHALRTAFAEAGDAPVCQRLRARLDRDWALIVRNGMATEYEHAVHQAVYVDTYEQCWRALRTPLGAATLEVQIAVPPEAAIHRDTARRLRELLAPQLADAPCDLPDRIAAILVEYLRAEQVALTVTAVTQRAINALLERPHPRRALTARDLHTMFVMYGNHFAHYPYLFNTIDDEFTVRVTCTADTIEITDRAPTGSAP